jgi:uncharacterized protein
LLNVEKAVRQWLDKVVIGLNLCPFASHPARHNRVRFKSCHPTSEEALLELLNAEMALLNTTPASELETTLVIIPDFLQEFYDYTRFLEWAQGNLKRDGWQGVFQLASFHPHYCFAGAEEGDAENLTNRAPYPIIHIIREASISAALNFVDDVDGIPERNKQKVEALTMSEKRELFPYLFSSETDN